MSTRRESNWDSFSVTSFSCASPEKPAWSLMPNFKPPMGKETSGTGDDSEFSPLSFPFDDEQATNVVAVGATDAAGMGDLKRELTSVLWNRKKSQKKQRTSP